MTAVRTARGLLGRAWRRLNPSPEQAARQRFEHEANRVPRHMPGRIRLLDLEIEYADALSTVPQWDDIFVRENLRFEPATPAPRVLDCGANIGLATLWLKRQFPGAVVTAFEADPTIAAILRRNLAANGALDVEIVEAAVWTSEGTVAFSSEGSDSGSVASLGVTAGRSIEVRAVRLRDRMVGERIDLLKLDIEGAERDVLGDCVDALGSVRAIHMEVHDYDPRVRRLPACLDALTRAGFRYTLADLHQTDWRSDMSRPGPFSGVAGWVIAVKAWRETTP
jgi:FkbM family methyltransferase